MEIITRTERRRIYNDDEKAAVVAASFERGSPCARLHGGSALLIAWSTTGDPRTGRPPIWPTVRRTRRLARTSSYRPHFQPAWMVLGCRLPPCHRLSPFRVRIGASRQLQTVDSDIMKFFFVGLSLIATTVGCDAAPPAAARPGRQKNPCKFVTPSDLGTGSTAWFGSCRDGLAEGLGVLRVESDGEVRLFAGAMTKGQPQRGFLDTGSPETTGSSVRFEGDRGLPPRNRAEIHQGCTVAADAATSVAIRFEKAGNPASAVYYSKWAKVLRSCLDKSGN